MNKRHGLRRGNSVHRDRNSPHGRLDERKATRRRSSQRTTAEGCLRPTSQVTGNRGRDDATVPTTATGNPTWLTESSGQAQTAADLPVGAADTHRPGRHEAADTAGQPNTGRSERAEVCRTRPSHFPPTS